MRIKGREDVSTSEELIDKKTRRGSVCSEGELSMEL